MAEIVNLNKVRKARQRAEREREASENRAKFGQSKANETRIEAERRRRETALDGARRDGDRTTDPDDDVPPDMRS